MIANGCIKKSGLMPAFFNLDYQFTVETEIKSA